MLLDFDLQTYSKHTIKMSSVSTRKLNFELWLISWHFVNEIQAFWLKNRLWRQFLKLWSKVIEKVFRFSIAINLTEVRFLFLRWNHSFFFFWSFAIKIFSFKCHMKRFSFHKWRGDWNFEKEVESSIEMLTRIEWNHFM